jgi:hypothetical protein
MTRALTILAAVVALAVSAAPASAGLLSSPLGVSQPPPRTAQVTGGVDLIDSLMTSFGVVATTHAGGEIVPGDFAKSNVNGGSNGIIAILIG